MNHGSIGAAARVPGIGRALVLVVALSLVAALAMALAPMRALAGEDTACGIRPIDLVLILDRSGSMNTQQGDESRLGWAKLAAEGLVSGLDGAGGVGAGGLHRVGVSVFGGTSASSPQALSAAADAGTVNGVIDGLSASGGTPFKQGMAAGVANMAGHRDFQDGVAVTHVFVLLSDGNPDPDSETPDATEIATYLGAAETAYSVTIGPDGGDLGGGGTGVSYAFMQSVANPPSAFRAVLTADDLPALFGDILDEITCPAINVEKTADPTELPAGGGSVTYTYAVTNTVDGGAPLSGVTVSDDKCSPVTFTGGDTSSDGLLQFGETWLYACSTTLTATTTNVATAQGSFDGRTFTDLDQATVTVGTSAPSQAASQAASQAPSPSQREDTAGGNPTPGASQGLPDTAGSAGGAFEVPATLLALTFIGSLGALAVVNRMARDRRR